MSVALILIPQSMAYAELAGLPSHHGLYAAALPLIVASILASSPYLQTGPVALTSLLTFGALTPLAPVGSAEYVALAALLAVVVGVVRILVGLLKLGWLVYLMSGAVMTGFLSAAAILILSSQLPGALGARVAGRGVLGGAWWALTHPALWDSTAMVIAALTVVSVAGASRIHPLVPGVLVASAGALVYSVAIGYGGATVGTIPGGFPPLTVELPWMSLPALLVPGFVIALVGFAEGLSIARLLAAEDRQRWSADREFLSKGMANVVAGLSGGLPVGGSLARTKINRLAGARSRWSGLVTGATVLLFLPFSGILAALPRSVLSGIVIAAIWSLIRPRKLLGLWSASPLQAIIAWSTFILTLWLAPRIDIAILLGVGLAIAVHLWRELSTGVATHRDGATLYLEPSGVLWFGSAPKLEDRLLAYLADDPEVGRVVIRLGGLGRIDLSGAYTLAEMIEEGRRAGIEVTLDEVPGHASRVLAAIGLRCEEKGPGSEPADVGASATPHAGGS